MRSLAAPVGQSCTVEGASLGAPDGTANITRLATFNEVSVPIGSSATVRPDTSWKPGKVLTSCQQTMDTSGYRFDLRPLLNNSRSTNLGCSICPLRMG